MKQWISVMNPRTGHVKVLPRREVLDDLKRNYGFSRQDLKKIIPSRGTRTILERRIKMKVKNLQGNNGPVKNQFIIYLDNGDTAFQSYDSVIVIRRKDGSIVLDNSTWDYSKTTGKYRNIFLGETKKETEAKIKAGIYTLGELN